MALNVTFNGFCYRDDGLLGDGNVQYRAYFHKVNTGSSGSKWNNFRTIEGGAAKGYWNINLGDGDWLTQTGNASAGDKVVIVFWRTGNNRNADCIILDEWGAFEITLTVDAVYINDIQVKKNILPNLSWTFPSTGYVNTSYNAMNNSEDEHSWTWSGTKINHWYIKHGQIINNVNQIDNTDYFWGDTTPPDLNLPGAAGSSHQWSAAGTYDIDIVIEDECGATVTGTKQIQIFNHAPECRIKCNQAVGQNITSPDIPVTFEYDGNDIDNKIQHIKWKINDSGAYGDTDTTVTGTNKTDTISHSNGLGTDWCSHGATPGAFTNPGDHLIEIWIKWWDGFATQTVYCSETFVQQKFTGPTVDFDQDPIQAIISSGVKFINSSTNINRVGLGLPDCDKYDWTWNDDGNIEYALDKPYSFELEKIPTTANCKVKLCADYSDGWDTHTTCEEKNVVFGTKVTITTIECYYNLNIVGTSGDGTVSGYSWTVSSGISETGPWTETWTCPIGLEQNDKKVCFTSIGWYRITGHVYGSGATTSDDETIYITTVCQESIVSVAVCNPVVISNEIGIKSMSAYEFKPSMRANMKKQIVSREINTFPPPKL